MTSAKNPPPFPAELPWEEFTERRVTIEELRERIPRHEKALATTFAMNPSTPLLPAHVATKLLSESELGLSETASAGLAHDLRAIGLWFLMPAGRRAADADLDATRRYLGELTRLSPDILPSLLHVLALLPVSVSEHLGQIPEWKESGHAFDIQMIRQFVRVLPDLSKRLAADVEAKSRGRRTNFVLDHSVTLAAAAFGRAGLSVGPRGQSATRPSARLTGAGSRLFVAYFRQLDKHLSETALALAMLRCRKRTRTVRT